MFLCLRIATNRLSYDAAQKIMITKMHYLSWQLVLDNIVSIIRIVLSSIDAMVHVVTCKTLSLVLHWYI